MILHGTRRSGRGNGTICQKTLCSGGTSCVRGRGDDPTRRVSKAQAERDNIHKLEFENLARAYLRLAKQTERKSQTNIVATPPNKERDQA